VRAPAAPACCCPLPAGAWLCYLARPKTAAVFGPVYIYFLVLLRPLPSFDSHLFHPFTAPALPLPFWLNQVNGIIVQACSFSLNPFTPSNTCFLGRYSCYHSLCSHSFQPPPSSSHGPLQRRDTVSLFVNIVSHSVGFRNRCLVRCHVAPLLCAPVASSARRARSLLGGALCSFMSIDCHHSLPQ
jgi:hypothetical protein